MSDETFFCYECRRDRPLRLYYDDGLCAEISLFDTAAAESFQRKRDFVDQIFTFDFHKKYLQ